MAPPKGEGRPARRNSASGADWPACHRHSFPGSVGPSGAASRAASLPRWPGHKIMISPALAGLRDVPFRLRRQLLSWPVAVRWLQLPPETLKSHKSKSVRADAFLARPTPSLLQGPLSLRRWLSKPPPPPPGEPGPCQGLPRGSGVDALILIRQPQTAVHQWPPLFIDCIPILGSRPPPGPAQAP